jgi:hypothetical protein
MFQLQVVIPLGWVMRHHPFQTRQGSDHQEGQFPKAELKAKTLREVIIMQNIIHKDVIVLSIRQRSFKNKLL